MIKDSAKLAGKMALYAGLGSVGIAGLVYFLKKFSEWADGHFSLPNVVVGIIGLTLFVFVFLFLLIEFIDWVEGNDD
jgi:hypothetical protein